VDEFLATWAGIVFAPEGHLAGDAVFGCHLLLSPYRFGKYE
jgi:hypothetical protein